MRSPFASKSARARLGSAAAPRSLALTSAVTSTPLTCTAVAMHKRGAAHLEQAESCGCAACGADLHFQLT